MNTVALDPALSVTQAILSAYLANPSTSLQADKLPGLVQQVYATVSQMNQGSGFQAAAAAPALAAPQQTSSTPAQASQDLFQSASPAASAPAAASSAQASASPAPKSYKGPRSPDNPAVSIEESVTPDYIICLEDGRQMKMLKRHLGTAYSMSPDEYRAKWGLPADYPMTAPRYAEQKSRFAKIVGLGRQPSGGRKRG